MPRKRRRKPAANKNLSATKKVEGERGLPASITPAELQRAVEEVFEQQPEFSAIIAEKYAGPVPHSNHLKQFEAVQPGLADRIVAMTEKQLALLSRWQVSSSMGSGVKEWSNQVRRALWEQATYKWAFPNWRT